MCVNVETTASKTRSAKGSEAASAWSERVGEPAGARLGDAQLIGGKVDAGRRPPGVGERDDEPSAAAADIEAPARPRAEQAQCRGDGLAEKLATAGRSDQVSYQSARPS